MARASTIHILRDRSGMLGAYTVKYECIDGLIKQVAQNGAPFLEYLSVDRVPDGCLAPDILSRTAVEFLSKEVKTVEWYAEDVYRLHAEHARTCISILRYLEGEGVKSKYLESLEKTG